MRYRHANEPQSLKKHINTLINNDDVLSTNEQDEIIGYFSDSLRCTLTFTKIVACLHLLIAAVYAGLLFSGSPLVFKVLSKKEKRDLESIWAERQAAAGATAAKAATASSSTSSASSSASDTDVVLAGIHSLYQKQRAEQQDQVMAYMTYRTALDTSPTLTPLTSVMMLFAALLLAVGGVACWRAARAFQVDKEALVNSEPRELGAGPLRGTVGGDSTAREAPAASAREGPARRPRRRPRSMKEAVVDPIWGSYTGIQLALAACALIPTMYWVRTLSRSHSQLNGLYQQLNLPTSSLFFGVTDDILELLLVVWQPLFHMGIFFMICSLRDTRDKLVGLASIKYRYDKL